MSAQKTVFVCLVVLMAMMANGIVELMSRTRAEVLVGQHGVMVSVCVGAEREDGCALVVRVRKE